MYLRGTSFSSFFLLCSVACGILVTQPGMELVPYAMEMWSLTTDMGNSLYSISFLWLNNIRCAMYIIFVYRIHQLMDVW